MPNQQLTAPPAKVEIRPKTYWKMLYHARYYANPFIPITAYKEVIGVLIGSFKEVTINDAEISIIDAIAITHGSRSHVEVQNYKKLAPLARRYRKDPFICGWYHSHPSHGIFMSATDKRTQTAFQMLYPKAIGIVIDPTKISATNYAIGIFRLTNDFSKWMYLEPVFSFDFNTRIASESLEIIDELIKRKTLEIT